MIPGKGTGGTESTRARHGVDDAHKLCNTCGYILKIVLQNLFDCLKLCVLQGYHQDIPIRKARSVFDSVSWLCAKAVIRA